MRLALAQINTVVGDLDGNAARVVGRLREARNAGADLVLFPELAVTGYPPEDLLFRPGFLREARKALEQIATETTDVAALIGVPWLDRDLFNGCAICAGGELKAVYPKRFLTNFDGFEKALADVFEGHESDITEENLQARIRGTLLMALSNKFGWLVVATGNKSELSVGYSTLYGDMAGGIALIDRAEYKRRQAPPGVKLRPKAFGRDRRTPITNRWRG